MSARDRRPEDTGPDAIPAFLRFVTIAILVAFLVGAARAILAIRAERYLAFGFEHLALLEAMSEISRCVTWAFIASVAVGIPALLGSFFFNRSFTTIALIASLFPTHDLVRKATQADPQGLVSRFGFLLRGARPEDGYATAALIVAVAAIVILAKPVRAACTARGIPTTPLLAVALTAVIVPGVTRAIASSLHKSAGPNVLLITIDTLRADHLSAYGYRRPTSPNLDELAARGLLFENAIAPAPRTTQSIASMMTSLYPQTHGIRTLWGSLPRARATLAERFRNAGYLTAGFWTTTFLDEKRGLKQGFSDYENTSIESDRAELVTDRAILWLADKVGARPDRGKKDRRRPFFLWLHYRDPHMPYSPPPEERLFTDRAYNGEFRDAVLFFPTKELMVYNHLGLIDSTDVAHAVGLYDGEIRYCDRQIGRLFKDLGDRGLTDNTIVLLTADHGEGLSEHGYYFDHGDLLYDSSVRVPLIVAGPEIPQGRVREQVSLLDVAPAIARLAGIPWTGEMEGSDLSDAIGRKVARSGAGPTSDGDPESDDELASGSVRAGDGDPVAADAALERDEPRLATPVSSEGETGARALFCESGENLLGPFNRFRFVQGIEGKMRSVRTDRWKLTMTPLPRGERAFALYDLAQDPAESLNVFTAQPIVADELTKRLEDFLRSAATGDDSRLGDIDEEDREKLRSMGYLGH
jgi:arylsulfatase A-like enzyme